MWLEWTRASQYSSVSFTPMLRRLRAGIDVITVPYYEPVDAASIEDAVVRGFADIGQSIKKGEAVRR